MQLTPLNWPKYILNEQKRQVICRQTPSGYSRMLIKCCEGIILADEKEKSFCFTFKMYLYKKCDFARANEMQSYKNLIIPRQCVFTLLESLHLAVTKSLYTPFPPRSTRSRRMEICY